MLMFVVNLLYQRFGAILMSRHRFIKLYYLKNQTFSPATLVGKLSYLSFKVSDNQYVSYVSVVDENGVVIDDQLLNEKSKNATSEIKFNLKNLNSSKLIIHVYDYAMNGTEYNFN